MFTEIEQQTLDIDWFFISGDKIGFVASAGGKLPDSVAILDEKIGQIVSFFRSLPEKTTVIINDELQKIKNTSITDSYLVDFIYMAKRGLYTFDKSLLNDFSDLDYHLVAKPTEFLSLEDLPSYIIDLINKTIYSENIESSLSININNFGNVPDGNVPN